MPEQTLVQQRIAYALGCVNNLKRSNSNNLGKYASYVAALPAAILMNGLGQAAATLKTQAASDSGNHSAYGQLYTDLNTWLCTPQCTVALYPMGTDLVTAIRSNSQDCYLRAQYEALQMLQWLKKFADVYSDKRKGNS